MEGGRQKTKANVEVPKVDSLDQKTLSEIAANYPTLIEKHSEFLLKIGADLGGGHAHGNAINLTEEDAEKFIVALKLKNHISNLNSDRAVALKEMTPESLARIKALDSEINDATEKLNRLSEI